MRRLRGIAVLSTFLCVFAATNAAAAPILTVYADRVSWEAAVGGSFTEETFNAFGGTSYEFAAVDVGDFSVSVAGDTFGFGFHNIGPDIVTNDVNGTGQLNAATGDTGGTSLAFDFPITAFGANWDGVSDFRTTSFNIGGTLLEIPNIEGGGFFGFVSDTAFSTPFLFLSSGAPDGFGMDNVVYSTVAPIPEPSTFALLGLGVLCFALHRRRKMMLS